MFAAFLFVLDFRYFMLMLTLLLMLTLMLVFLLMLMLILHRRRGRHVFNFETPEHCEQEGENAQKGFNIQTSSKSTLAFPTVLKSPHSFFTNSCPVQSPAQWGSISRRRSLMTCRCGRAGASHQWRYTTRCVLTAANADYLCHS